jgi:hypothetical protein
MWESVWQSIVIPLVSVLVGAFITWWVSRYYYKRAGDELKIESGRIRKLINLIGRALEQFGPVEFKRDDKGEISSIYVDLKGTISAKSKLTGTLTVDKKAEDSKTPE